MRRILVIPLLAAVWIGMSGYVSAEQRPARGGGSRGADRGATSGGDRQATRGGDRGGPRTVDAGRIDGQRPPRGGAPVYVQRRPPTVVGAPYNRGYAYPAHRYDPWIRRYYGWSPVRYAPWGWIYGTSALAGYYSGYYWPYYSGYYAPYYAPYPYYGSAPYYPPFPSSSYYSSGSSTSSTFDTGAVRLRVRPRDAEVYVDGSYTGVVNDFDGVFQEMRLSPGSHRIEVRKQGFESATFDVHIQPGRTVDLRQDLRPTP